MIFEDSIYKFRMFDVGIMYKLANHADSISNIYTCMSKIDNSSYKMLISTHIHRCALMVESNIH